MDKIKIGTWNIENLVERFHEKYKSDRCLVEYGVGRIRESKEYKKLTPQKLKRISEIIKKNNADVLALQEVDDLDQLKSFNRMYLNSLYPYVLLIEGNDPRYIDLGLLSKLPIGNVRTHQYLKYKPRGAKRERFIFSRDLLEVDILSKEKKLLLTIFVNHFKSKREMKGQKPSSASIRERQAQAVRDRIKEKFGNSNPPYVIVGDMNDTPNSEPLKPLFQLLVIDVISSLPSSRRWTHYYKAGKEHNQLDHILVSSTFKDRFRNVFIERRGMVSTTPGLESNEKNNKIRKKGEEASDHAAVFVELEL